MPNPGRFIMRWYAGCGAPPRLGDLIVSAYRPRFCYRIVGLEDQGERSGRGGQHWRQYRYYKERLPLTALLSEGEVIHSFTWNG
jgi:hypothetical protein